MIPRLKASLVKRPRLLEALDGSSGLTFVSAPSGFGKTVLLAQWARELVLRGESVHWRRGDDGDTLSTTALDGTVIIDGLSAGDTEKIAEQLAARLSGAPGVRVVVATRDYVRAGLQGSQVLTETDLAFTAAEAENLACVMDVDPAVGKTAWDGMEAWPLGVASALEPAQMGEFARGVYNSLPRGTPRRMLTTLAGISKVRPSLMPETLGLPESEVRQAKETLVELGYAAEGTDCTGEFLWVRPALQDYLWELGGADRSDCTIMRRAQALAEVDCAPAESMSELMDLGELGAAQKVALEHLGAVLEKRQHSLASLRSVPLERLEKYPSLLLSRLILERPDGTIPVSAVETTARELHASLVRERSQLDVATYARRLAMQIAAERMMGMWDSALELSYELLDVTSQPKWLEAASDRKEAPIVFAVPALAGILAGDSDLAAEASDAGNKLASAQGNALEQVHALSLGALNLALQGDVHGASDKLKRATEVGSTVQLDPPEFSWVDGALAEVLVASFRGDGVSAKRRLGELTPLMERMEQWPVVTFAESSVTRMQDGAAEALGLIEHRLDSRPAGLAVSPTWRETLKCRRADLATWAGRYEEAQQILDGAGAGESREIQGPRSVLSRARLELYRGRYAKAAGEVSSVNMGEVAPSVQRELLLVSALANFKLGNLSRSRGALDAALMAEPEGSLADAVSGMPHTLLVEAAQTFELEGLGKVLESLPETLRTDQHSQLSKTEKEVLVALAEEKTMVKTAQDLFISINTLKSHSRSIYQKLGVGSREEAVAAARRRGLI